MNKEDIKDYINDEEVRKYINFESDYSNGIIDKTLIEIETVTADHPEIDSNNKYYRNLIDTLTSSKDILIHARDIALKILDKCDEYTVGEFYMLVNGIRSLLYGTPIYALSGNDDEWEECEKEFDKLSKTIEFYSPKLGKVDEYTSEINIESIEVNKRYSNIYRINKDNSLAFRVDAITMENDRDDFDPIDGIRFIEFPWPYKDSIIIPDSVENPHKYINEMDFYFDGTPIPKKELESLMKNNEKEKEE